MSAPPPVPPVSDTDRYKAYTPGGVSTASVAVPFPIYGDGSDLRVILDGIDATPGSWSLISASGSPLSTLSQPITDGMIFFSPSVAPQTIEIYGAIHPRQLVMPTAPGLGRREFNQAMGYILSALREAWTLGKLFRNQPLGFDASGPLANRAQYDTAAKGFRFARTDEPSGKPILYVKNSATSGDWSQAISFQGPAGVNATGGTVTSVGTGYGLTGGPITTTGTIALDPTALIVGLRNRLLNGGMAIDQRNVGAAVTLGVISGVTNYTVDRWGAYLSAGSAGFTAQRTAVQSGGIDYALRLQRANTTVATPTIYLHQALETRDCIDLQAKTVTLSLKARVGADFSGSGGVLNFSVISGTGADQSTAALAGGTWTGQSTLASGTGAVGSNFATFSVQAAVPAGATQLAVRIWVVPTGTAGANDWIDITDVQLEPGAIANASIATERRPYGYELSRCQRFFQKSLSQANALATNVGTEKTGVWQYAAPGLSVPFSMPMRAAPALTLYDALGASGKVSYWSGAAWVNAYATFTTPEINSTFFIFKTGGAGLTYGFDYAANAEL